MERRRAMVISAAGAVLSAGVVVAGATGMLHHDHSETLNGSAASISLPPTGADDSVPVDPAVVTQTKDVYDTVMVPTLPSTGAADEGSGASTSTSSSTSSPSSTSMVAPSVHLPTDSAVATGPSATNPPSTTTTAPRSTQPTTPPSTTTTTAPAPTTTTTAPSSGGSLDWLHGIFSN